MHLTPREIDKLLLHQAGVLAQKRLARGLRLNYVEAVALIATQLLEFIREGHSVATLMDLGRQILGRADVLDGVAAMIDEVQVEGTFPDGTKLVTVHHPIVAERGDRVLALFGSFLAIDTPIEAGVAGQSASPQDGAPGAAIVAEGEIVLNEGRETVEIQVVNRGDRPIQVGSHFHFFEVNPRLRFDRAAAYGRHLAITAGSTVRFDPGAEVTVPLVPFGGVRVVVGFSGLVDGPLDAPGALEAALERARACGFLGA